MMIKKIFKILFGITFLFAFGCNNQTQENYVPEFSKTAPRQIQEYIFGVHPLHNPKRLQEIFGPLTDYLSEKIPNAIFRLEASRNYASYDEKLYAGKFHFALPNPYQTVNSLKHGYSVFGKMGDDENFCGIIIVLKNGNIKTIEDLKGKAVSFPAPTALAATMMPQYYMQMHGIDVMKDIDIKYVGSQESSIMNVFYGNTVAATTWPPPWNAFIKEHPEIAQKLEVKWTTKHLINNGLVVRNDVPLEVVKQVEEIFFNLHTHEKGKFWLKRMELSKFESANNQSYKIVTDYLEGFNTKVRPIVY